MRTISLVLLVVLALSAPLIHGALHRNADSLVAPAEIFEESAVEVGMDRGSWSQAASVHVRNHSVGTITPYPWLSVRAQPMQQPCANSAADKRLSGRNGFDCAEASMRTGEAR